MNRRERYAFYLGMSAILFLVAAWMRAWIALPLLVAPIVSAVDYLVGADA